MTVRNVKKNLAGQQDLLPGLGPYEQIRRGQTVTVDGPAKSYFDLFVRSYAEAGLPVKGTIEDGCTLDTVDDIAVYLADGKGYSYSGTLPHMIGAGETPIGNPNWVVRARDSLRADLAKPTGPTLIKFKRSFLNSILFPLSVLLEHSTVNAVAEAGADPTGVLDSTAAIHAALGSGYDVYLGPGRYKISGLLYPHFDGQRLYGAGDELTEIFNDTNAEPLWCYGNPFDANGARQWCEIANLKLSGNLDTLWGIFNPNAAFVDGTPNTAGQYEGVSSSPNNFYFGRTSVPFADWAIAARGSKAENVSVHNVDGGFSLHCSSWGARFNNIRLWSGKEGLRVSGASNGNSFRDFYISGMSGISWIEPDRPQSIPVACTYSNMIVQQSGKGTQHNRAIELLKSQGSTITGLYLERNTEKGAIGDVFIGVSCLGLNLQSVRHRNGTIGDPAIIIENQGNGTTINAVVYGDAVDTVVLNSGADPRTKCAVGIVSTDGGSFITGEVVNTSDTKRLTRFGAPNVPVTLGAPNAYAYEITRGIEIRQALSTTKVLDVVSQGSMNFIVDAVNSGPGRVFKFSHNGTNGTETSLIEINDSGQFYPSTANTGLIGTTTKPFSGGFTQTAYTVTSDERYKTAPLAITDAMLDAAAEVDWVQYQYLDRVEAKGADGARWHFGAIAQRFVEAFARHGLEAHDYGFLCFDKWDYQPEVWQTDPAEYGEDGALISPERTYKVQDEIAAGERYGIRYEEAFALEAALQRRNYQRLLARIEALEAK